MTNDPTHLLSARRANFHWIASRKSACSGKAGDGMIPLTHILIFTLLLFLIGLYGALTRRNIVGILMSIEIMLNAVNVNFVAFASFMDVPPELGQIFVMFIIVLAAATASVGLAIVFSIYRNQKTVYTDEINLLKW